MEGIEWLELEKREVGPVTAAFRSPWAFGYLASIGQHGGYELCMHSRSTRHGEADLLLKDWWRGAVGKI